MTTTTEERIAETSGQIPPVVLTTEEERRQKNERDWLLALDGLDRAVAWIKANRQHLCRFHIQLEPTPKTGITVHLGLFHDDDKRAEVVRILFGGKSATKRLDGDGSSEGWCVEDDALQIVFRWSVWHHLRKSEPVTEKLVI